MVGVDQDTGATIAATVGSKVEDDHAFKKVMQWIKFLGHQTMELRVDQAAEMTAIQERIRVQRAAESPMNRTIPSWGKLHDSQSMGAVESCISQWRAKMKTLRYFLQDTYGCIVGTNHPIWPYMIKHAARLNIRFTVKPDGRTAWWNMAGKNYNGQIWPFGEIVSLKVPETKS